MAPRTQKRKAASQTSPAAKKAKSSSKAKSEPNVVGGMKGDYRVTGSEQSPFFDSFTVLGSKGQNIPCQLWGRQTTSHPRLVFTHGAGGGIDNPATKCFAEGYSGEGSVVLFQGTMNLKSRVKTFEAVLQNEQDNASVNKFVVGGRSMGARAAVLVATDSSEIEKLVLASYPLTSPKGEDRDQILLDLPKNKEVLFINGSQDSMCDLDKLRKVMTKMQAKSTLLVVDGADHGMSLGSGTGVKGKDKDRVVEALRKMIGQLAARWVKDSQTVKIEEISAADIVNFDNQEKEYSMGNNHVDADADAGSKPVTEKKTDKKPSRKKR